MDHESKELLAQKKAQLKKRQKRAEILSNQLESLEVYYGTVFEEKGRNAG